MICIASVPLLVAGVRISVFRWVELAIVREKEMPASVAPESFQAQERFVSVLAPILARSLEAALGLPTR